MRQIYMLPLSEAPARYPVGDRYLCLVPIFSCRFFKTDRRDAKAAHRLEVYTRCALHARRTWMEHTDAREHGVAVKFYVEEAVLDRVGPVLASAGVNLDSEVIVFSDVRPAREWARLSKETAMLWDARFRDYEWVVVGDADLYIPREGIPFFSRLSAVQGVSASELGFLKIYRGRGVRFSKRVQHKFRKGLKRYPAAHARIGTCMYQARKSFEDMREILEGLGLEWEITEDTHIVVPDLALTAFPARFYHLERQDFLGWLHDNAPRLGTGETCLEIAYQLFGYPFWGMDEVMGIRYKSIFMEGLWPHEILHNRPNDDVQGRHLLERIGHDSV